MPVEHVQAITGFEFKPQGLCAGEICIAISPGANWITELDGATYFNVSRFAKSTDQVFAVDTEKNVWSFTPVPRPETNPLLAGQAPDFSLLDRNGKAVKLSDFRGKKVLLMTWASWCGCRFDLAGWQKVYDDLKGKNFEIIAAAQDTAGPSVVNKWYDNGKVTYTALVDPNHTVSSLYQMVNVPMGVWIDENGQIVRSAEVAYSKHQVVMKQDIGDDRYAAGIRDWVEKGRQKRVRPVSGTLKGEARQFALPSSVWRMPNSSWVLTSRKRVEHDLAAKHWHESQRLNPDSWNYHRQEWSYDKSKEMANWLSKVRRIGR